MAKRDEPTNLKPTHEEIAKRARAIYEASGRVPGRDLENWLAAETELTATRASRPEAMPSPRSMARSTTTQRQNATRAL